MDWSPHWYPVAYLKDLDRSRPTPFTLLEQDLVLWWDRHQHRWRAFADVCPHRLVPLSEGRLNASGELECPYHGWTFNGDGRCTAIPQAASGTNPSERRSQCRSYATAEGQGLLFVFAGEPERADQVPLPLVPVLDDPAQASSWTVQDTFRDLPMDALTLLENVLDVSHVPFTHHATVGRRENAGPVALQLESFGPEGFTGVWEEGPRRGKLGRQHTRFVAPCLMWHDLTARGFARILTVVYATPIRRGECRLFARFPFQFASPWPGRLLKLRPEWLQHLGNHTVLEDDQLFLHWQERALEARGGSPAAARAFHLASDADLYVKALHDWINTTGGEPFSGARLPARLGLEALMDREHTHTRHCRSCRTAQRRLRLGRQLGWGVLLAGLGAAAWLGASPGGAVALGVVALVALAQVQAGRWLGQLQRGAGQPPRNRS